MVEGLTYVPQVDDGLEYIPELFDEIADRTEPLNYFSYKNREVVLRCMLELGLNKYRTPPSGYLPPWNPGTILEIGVGESNRFLNTSTFILTGFKHTSVKYFGIDKADRRWLEDYTENINLYRTLSNIALEEFKHPVNLLLIDGGHSITTAFNDWKFTKYVVHDGIILIHDIKAHTGPIELVKAIDRDIYIVHELFLDDPKDFGMAVVYKKENRYDSVCR